MGMYVCKGLEEVPGVQDSILTQFLMESGDTTVFMFCLFVWGFSFSFFYFFILQNSLAWINNSRLSICFLLYRGLLFTNIYSGLGFAAVRVLGIVCRSSLPGVCICS